MPYAERLKIERNQAQYLDDLRARETTRGNWTKESYSNFLQEYYWEDFYTVTFREPRKEPYYTAKSVWKELEEYFAVRSFMVVEPFQSGDLHVHGLVSGNLRGWRPELKLPWDIWDGLYSKFGRSRIEACNSPERVGNYCAKYVLKQQSSICDYYYIFGDKWSWQNGKM